MVGVAVRAKAASLRRHILTSGSKRTPGLSGRRKRGSAERHVSVSLSGKGMRKAKGGDTGNMREVMTCREKSDGSQLR